MKKGMYYGCIPGGTREEKFRNARDAGFDGVEVDTLRTDADREETKALAEKYGVAVPSVMNTDHWKYPLSDPDPEVRRKSLLGVRQSVETAVALGADTVLIVPGVVGPDVTYEEVFERSKESIKEILPLAEEKDILIAVENVWNKFLLSPVEFASYVDGFASDHLVAYFDAGNICLYGYPDHWIRTLGGRIRKVHVKGFDTGRSAFGGLMKGTVDWKSVSGALHEIGYDDFITAELEVEGEDKIAGLKKLASELGEIIDPGRAR